MITIILGLSLKISPAQNIISSFERRKLIKIDREILSASYIITKSKKYVCLFGTFESSLLLVELSP